MNYTESAKKEVRAMWEVSKPLIDEPIFPRNACLYKLTESEVIALRKRIEHLASVQEIHPPSEARYEPAYRMCPKCQEEFNMYGGCKCNGYTTGLAESVPSL